MSETGHCLHIIGTSSEVSAGFAECQRFINHADAILLTGSGVNSIGSLSAKPGLPGVTIYALKADIDARGLNSLAEQHSIRVIDDAGFVQLVVAYSTSQTWC